MKQTIINGVTLYRRPASGACPKGAWFGKKHHTSWVNGCWNVWETGVQLCACFSTAKEAKLFISGRE